ncbi:bifunctional [glutamine synthetase] adenylyltransferase/[glutamine synthetase]-adenylyl-L-tyrosine phosphorylase [Sphingosinicella sp. LY1275]|uniref:bifunctional [glutamine synthetase] adenylyltransferase/[glutamine synthetase]-adenylyl-L-tyrosine phosphorylase n=1 Tax=Sphingosinicella sp. LY1275 TaxID=3095379 RepID=UPI002ADEEEA7|nr:bifunctional [glutamine synthetase] adenylyltransferase/[glutamine synthetase]-adenylyl-L-tyrosine phosphorylase [Sphingosinicella sp. LY1275]MEA1014939.1 bifunctional [glutamine synthetase] adenylyltransferase/[glutamine synthetase]-adenylyl-L-tyrosine phosphorylase [Sphingosinicella sp. LY1275]
MSVTQSKPAINDALERGRRHSPFLKLQLDTQPRVAEALASGDLDRALEIARGSGVGAETLAASLRRERSALALALGIGDLAGLLPLERVVGELSDLADRVLEQAVAGAIAQRTPDAEPAGFAVIALGKHGSRELNYSSDVDLLFLFDPALLPLKPREDPGQGAVRIGQRVIELVQKRDGDGYAFRVDLRLRPSPEVTPIALPVDAAISYYESSALPWERAAFIRARCVAGDRRLGQYFLDAIHPFVWRRSLDFGAIGELQSITRRIRDHYAQGQAFGPGFDLKRGRGGIREIEFFAQIHQLIHGGRAPKLRAPATLDALELLAQDGRITPTEAASLSEAYRLFRTVEHRLQMVDDKQTHTLPADGAALDNVARLHGVERGDMLLGLLEPHVTEVAAAYSRLGAGEGATLPRDPAALEARLREAGFDDPGSARLRIENWRTGKARSLRTPAAVDAFEAMLPALIDAFGRSPDSMRAVNRFDDVVTRLPSGVNFYRLLEARPGLTGILASVLSYAPALADQLGRRPELLDGLIDSSAFEPVRPIAALAKDYARSDRADEDYQLLLDRVRRRVNEARFALGVQLIAVQTDPLEIAAGYARIAEAAIQVFADAAIAEFERRHGKVPGSELVILGLGRLGGGALTHASDLDLIYVFTGTHEAVSDGPKPLGATDYFNRLAPRVTAALSVATAAGPLYDVDTRLRPSGKDGMIAVSLASFADYQRTRAWTWEHMALTRARPVYGSAQGRAALASAVDDVLHQERDVARLVADAGTMREDMARHKPPSGPFDIKLGEGGLVDLEFAVHVLQLQHRTAFHPRLDDAIDALIAAGLLPVEVADAHRLLTRMLVAFRLVSPRSDEPPPASRELVARACGLENWDALLAAHDGARQRISQLWRAIASTSEIQDGA